MNDILCSHCPESGCLFKMNGAMVATMRTHVRHEHFGYQLGPLCDGHENATKLNGLRSHSFHSNGNCVILQGIAFHSTIVYSGLHSHTARPTARPSLKLICWSITLTFRVSSFLDFLAVHQLILILPVFRVSTKARRL